MIALVTGSALAAELQPDDCQNADRGPGANGPPGFVGGLVPDGLADLFGDLPVPDVGNGFFGAPSCG